MFSRVEDQAAGAFCAQQAVGLIPAAGRLSVKSWHVNRTAARYLNVRLHSIVGLIKQLIGWEIWAWISTEESVCSLCKSFAEYFLLRRWQDFSSHSQWKASELHVLMVQSSGGNGFSSPPFASSSSHSTLVWSSALAIFKAVVALVGEDECTKTLENPINLHSLKFSNLCDFWHQKCRERRQRCRRSPWREIRFPFPGFFSLLWCFDSYNPVIQQVCCIYDLYQKRQNISAGM